MLILHRYLSFLVFSAVTLALVSCEESDDAKQARYAKAMENAKVMLKVVSASGADDPSKQQRELTPEEKAAEDPTKKLIVFCASSLNDPFQRLQADMMRAAVRTLDGYRYKVLDAAGDVSKQLDILGQVPNQQPVWLLVSPVEDRLSAAVLESMKSSGVKIVALDQRVPESSCEALIFTDQAKIGQLAGQVALKALRRKAETEGKKQVTGRVVQVRGPDDAFVSKARGEAFAEALKAEPGIVLVHDAGADWTPEGGKKCIDEARRLQGTFDVIFAQNDAMARGISEVLTTAQQRDNVLIIGVDGTGGRDGGIDLVRRGVIDATIWQPMPLETAFSLIQKTANDPKFKPEHRYEREPIAITPRTVDEFLRGAAAGGK